MVYLLQKRYKKKVVICLVDIDELVDNGLESRQTDDKRISLLPTFEWLWEDWNVWCSKKSKIKPAIKCDKNTKHYIGIRKMKTWQMTIKGVKVKGD